MLYGLQNGVNGLVRQPEVSGGGDAKIFWGIRIDTLWTQAYGLVRDLRFYDESGGTVLVVTVILVKVSGDCAY